MSLSLKNKTYIDELQEIKSRNPDGLLIAKEVVDYARDENTALHSRFEWDDEKASELYRIFQARNIIRATVVFSKNLDRNVHAFVSLYPDRENDDGGYRDIQDVLKSGEWRKQMLEDAKRDLLVFKEKYELIEELVGVFREIDKIFR